MTVHKIAPPPPRPTNLDGLTNVVTGLGTAKSKRESNRWVYDLINQWQQLEACFQSNWIARQIVSVPAEDATREWRRIKAQDAEAIAAVEQQLKLQSIVNDALHWSRLYGGSGILMCTGQDLSKPLNLNKVKKGSLERLIVLDRWEMNPTTINNYDILAPNYMRGEFYTLQGGQQQVHWSHFAFFHGEKLPRRQMAYTQGWGDSVLRKCIEDVNDTVASKGGIAELMQEANIDVITREGLSEELASDQDGAITDRYALFSQMKSIINMALLDGDEKLERQTLNLTGVAPVIENFMIWLCGAARIPMVKLFGTSAKGMNATGEGDLSIYYDDVSAMQTSTLSDPMRTLDEVMVRSALGTFPSDYDYEWNPLNQPNQLETAQADNLEANTNQMYLDMGVVTRSQIQRELQAKEQYQFDDKAIEQAEELEDPNLFEELPGVEAESTDSFLIQYKAMIDAGLEHDDVMKQLTDGE